MSDSSFSAEAGATDSLQNFNRTIIGTEVVFSFPIGPALVCDIVSSLPSPLYAVITDDIVYELYGRALVQAFLDQGARAMVYVLPNGEVHKSRHCKELIEDWMVSACAFVHCRIVTFW
jgi:hypothetical protein